MRKTGYKKGLGLIEIMAATLIIGFASAGTVTVFLSGEKTISEVGRKLEAYNLCQETMENLLRQGYDSLSITPSTVDPLPVDSVLREYFQGTRTYTISLIQPGIKMITVTLTWNEGGSTERSELISLVTNHD